MMYLFLFQHVVSHCTTFFGNGSDSIDRLLWDTSVSSTPAITSHRASAEAVDGSTLDSWRFIRTRRLFLEVIFKVPIKCVNVARLYLCKLQ